MPGVLLGRTAFDVSDGTDGTLLIRYDSSHRLTASVEYRLSDQAALEWTFGREFALAGADAGELLSLFSVKWALGQVAPIGSPRMGAARGALRKPG